MYLKSLDGKDLNVVSITILTYGYEKVDSLYKLIFWFKLKVKPIKLNLGSLISVKLNIINMQFIIIKFLLWITNLSQNRYIYFYKMIETTYWVAQKGHTSIDAVH